MKLKHNMLVAFTGGSLSAIAYLFGGVDNLFIALGILMASDYLTGVAAAFYNKQVSSKNGFRGIVKKLVMLLLVIVAVQVDNVIGNDSQVIRYAMIMYLLGTEGISLVENLGKMGIKVPDFLSDRFAQLKNDNENNTK
jgi:toxin secretion/phage lysis holin